MLPNTGRMRYDDVRMPYLERRIEKLLSDYKAAKLIFRADSTELLVPRRSGSDRFTLPPGVCGKRAADRRDRASGGHDPP